MIRWPGWTWGSGRTRCPPTGGSTVTVKAAALNHHDVWTLRGVGISADRLPIVLGCDAAGLDPDGNEVIVHSVIADPDAGGGDETLDPRRSLLSERHDGTFAEQVAVPRRNLVPKPSALSFEEAACLPTAYLTAYKMLFEKSGVQPGATMLVQGAGGGVATALILLGRAAGYRIWATSRSEAKRERAVKLGADQAFAAGARLPERVDVVMETVGAGHLGAFGPVPAARRPDRYLRRDQRRRTAGRADQDLLHSAVGDRLHDGHPRPAGPPGPVLRADRRPPGNRPGAAVGKARDGFAAMIAGDLFGKVVFTSSPSGRHGGPGSRLRRSLARRAARGPAPRGSPGRVPGRDRRSRS